MRYFSNSELKSGMKVVARDGNEYLCVKDCCHGDLFGLISLGNNERTYYLPPDCFRYKKSRVLSDDELWAKAAQGGHISREELGIAKSSSYNVLTSLSDVGLSAYNPTNDIVRVEQLSVSDMDKLIKHIKNLYYNNPIDLEWQIIAKE